MKENPDFQIEYGEVEDYEMEYERLNALKRLKGNVSLFARTCFPTAMKKETPPFHSEIYQTIKNPKNDRVIIAAPRGSAKSTAISLIYPLYKIGFKKSDEELFIMIISEAQQQSINFLSRIKFHLSHSQEFRDLFGDLGMRTAKKWTSTSVTLANNSRIVAVGTGQRVRGWIEGDTRPNLIIVDDFESELNANTPEARTKNRRWITEAVIPSLADEGQMIVVGTVISEDCFLFWAKDSRAWKSLWYSIIDPETGGSIWPDKFPMWRIKKIRDEYEAIGNISGFFQEYMNIPQSPDEAPFQPGYIQYHDYEYKQINGENYMYKQFNDGTEKIIPVNVYGGIDPASSLAQRADFFVIFTCGVDADNNIYEIDTLRGHINPAFQPDKIIETFKKYHHKRMKVETTAYQEALRQSVRRIMFDNNIFIPGLEKGVKPRTPKSERLLSLVPFMAKKKVFFKKGNFEAVNEFLSYPRGRNDDIMDAVWTALDGYKPAKKKNIVSADEMKEKKRRKLYNWKVF